MIHIEFADENLLRPKDSISQINQGNIANLSIRCPHCRTEGTFQPAVAGITWKKWGAVHSKNNAGQNIVSNQDAGLIGAVRVCPNPNCLGIIFTVSYGRDSLRVLPPEVLDFTGDNLPPALLQTLEEAVACHSVGAYRAAAMMVRRLLEELCDTSGAKGKNLHQRLEALKTKVTLPEELFDAMGELKALGNDAAHVTAKEYVSIGKDEAEDSIELAKEILKARYQLKGLVDRLKARKANQTP